MIILGIETSCDETALALLETRESVVAGNKRVGCRVIGSLVHSQAELHSAYGGVFPSLAKREHGKNLVPLLEKLLRESGESLKDIRHDRKEKRILSRADFNEIMDSFRDDILPKNQELFQAVTEADFLNEVPSIDAIAVTEGPGLEPALWVGINFARLLGALWQIPIIPIDHMEGHIVGSLLSEEVPYGAWQELKHLPLPSLALLISGGHTELVRIGGIGTYEIVGRTLDDAVGEAFDKVARLLGLPYPGGPHISRLAEEAREGLLEPPMKLPRPMMMSGNFDFSFSGLKTAVLYAVRKAQETGQFTEDFKKGLAREFEQAVTDVIGTKTRSAIGEIGAQSLVVGGGVSANRAIRATCEKTAAEFHIPLFLPSRHVSGDNALMIALAGSLHGIPKVDKTALHARGTKRLG